MSCPDLKKRCKKKTLTVCHPKRKPKKHRVRVAKKIVCKGVLRLKDVYCFKGLQKPSLKLDRRDLQEH